MGASYVLKLTRVSLRGIQASLLARYLLCTVENKSRQYVETKRAYIDGRWLVS